MKIRAKLNLWYSTVLFLALLMMGGWSYHEFIYEKLHPDPEEMEEEESDLGELTVMLTGTLLPSLLFGFIGGWWLTRKALAPVVALKEAAKKTHEGSLNQKLPLSGSGDEFDQLTEVFNEMTSRLDNSFQKIREFTLHASHELKTPLTILHGEMETALMEEQLSPNQKERLASQIDEIQRLAKIVDGLTLLTKADSGHVQLNLKDVPLDEIVREAYDDAEVLSRPEGINVKLEDCFKTVINGNRDRLRQMLLNLLDNAIKYNHAKGIVKISLKHSNSSAELEITNTGPVIPAEALPRIFDRFYRGDPSHNSTTEGNGLGLSIVQWIVSAHKGNIVVTSDTNQGTKVLVTLPLKMLPQN